MHGAWLTTSSICHQRGTLRIFSFENMTAPFALSKLFLFGLGSCEAAPTKRQEEYGHCAVINFVDPGFVTESQ